MNAWRKRFGNGHRKRHERTAADYMVKALKHIQRLWIGTEMAWIGFPDKDAAPFLSAAYHGVYNGDLETQRLIWGDLKHGADGSWRRRARR